MIQKNHVNWSLLLIFLLVVASPNISWGEDVYTIRNNGDPANRIDIVILGDGYTASQLTDYVSDIEDFVTRMFQQEPFYEYAAYFNVHRIDVISNESGADHPTRDIYVDTALDATYYCNQIQRLICVDISKVLDILNNSGIMPNQQDAILVIVNDPERGGSGGYIAVSSTHQLAVDIILHELGHSFGQLGDEYDYGNCNNTIEPSNPNVTKETNRNLIKWNVGGGPPTGWIELTTPVPTTGTTLSVPGLYEGAKYCFEGLYRPTYNSKMRTSGAPFDQINEEQLIKRIYNFVSPLDSYYPLANDLSLFLGDSLEFGVGAPQPASQFLDVTWLVDDVVKGTGTDFNLDSSKNLSVGIHTVEAIIQDTTSRVRNDPADVLTESRSWQVTIASRDHKLIINTGVGGTTDPTPGTYSYDTGTGVAITATPGFHYDFSNWSGDVPLGQENDNPLTITMASDKSITANFVLKQYTLTIAAGTGGTTIPVPGTYSYDAMTDVAITATPDGGYGLTSWSGDAAGTANPLTITMDGDKSITASFIRQYTLTIGAGEGGTTVPTPGSYTHNSGTQVSITAGGQLGYEFSNWTGDASGTTNPITITIDSDKSVTANFIASTATDGGGATKKKGCFIATAAYGSRLHPYVETLQEFRDKYLMPSRIGRMLVDFYYEYSPYIAELIARHKVLRAVVRLSLLPLIASSYLALRFDPAIASLFLVFIFVLSYFVHKKYFISVPS
jgi:uncharacterized repeat protein (TIGR02543 family)